MKWIALFLLALCGCASDVALPPAQISTADFGVTPMPNHIFVVTYKGSAQASRERVLDLALLKASQITRENELKYFVVVDPIASKPGETKYRSTLPGPAEFNNELIIQAFKGRPARTFSFRADATERTIYDKLRHAEETEAL